MALHDRKSLMKLCDISTQYISVNVKRGKLIPIDVKGREYFSDQETVNAQFIAKRRKKLQEKGKIEQISTNLEQKPTEVVQKSTKMDQENVQYKLDLDENDAPVIPEKKPEPNGQLNFFENTLDRQKKELEVEKLKETVQLEKLKKEKQMGLVIPTDMVITLFVNTFKVLTNKFYVAAEDIASNTVAQFGGGREEMILVRQRIMEAINKANQEGTDQSLSMIDKIVLEYSEKRMKGQRV